MRSAVVSGRRHPVVRSRLEFLASLPFEDPQAL